MRRLADAFKVGRSQAIAAQRDDAVAEDLHWSPQEIASFSMHPGGGRVLAVRPGGPQDSGVEACLRDAGYALGRLPLTREPSHLPQAAATFAPDVIYVLLDRAAGLCLGALEALANDPTTEATPLVALVPEDATPALIEEAYARAGCDFFRLGATNVELLARTHLLVRLAAQQRGDAEPVPPIPEAANQPVGARLDLWDPTTQAYSATYLRSRLPSEVARAIRYRRDLSLVAVRSTTIATRSDMAAALAHRLRQKCRNVDMIARYEDDAFVLLLPETDAEGVATLTERLHTMLEEMDQTAAIGAATLGESDAHTGTELLRLVCRRADDSGGGRLGA